MNNQPTSQNNQPTSQWDDSENYNSPQHESLRNYVKSKEKITNLLGFKLTIAFSGSVVWFNENVMDSNIFNKGDYLIVYVSYYKDKGEFLFTDDDSQTVYGTLPMIGDFDKSEFLNASKKALTKALEING